MLHQQIKDDIKKAMLARESVKLDTLRGLLAAFTNELVAKKRKPTEFLTDEEATAVIARQVKQRKDSIEQFEKGGRKDLSEGERAEIAFLVPYLPAQLSERDVRDLAMKKKTALGVNSKDGAGKLMSALMADLKGKVDGGLVKKIVDEVLT